MRWLALLIASGLAGIVAAPLPAGTKDTYPTNYVAATLVQLNDNGAGVDSVPRAVRVGIIRHAA